MRPAACTHTAVAKLVDWVRPHDVLVVNDAEVIAARLHGKRPTGGNVEVLLVEPVEADGTWQCSHGGGRIPAGKPSRSAAVSRASGESARAEIYRRIRLQCDGDLSATLQRVGELPLPPYIRRPTGPSSEDRERYQTMFARTPGAIAAPTAGLHFTPALVAALQCRGVRCVPLTLIVGPATFLPVRTASLAEHEVPPERYEIPAATAAAITAARADGGRVVAVGTTTVRALETVATNDGTVTARAGRSDLVIGPGHRFRAIDALLTNFHLPRSSLLALVAAFAGVETTLTAYRAATTSRYRFYSYGDAMLVV